MIAALEEISLILPFPLLGVDSDNGSEFINHHLLHWCEQRKLTFTRSRPGNSNDGAHVEQKNWAVVRTVVGYHRYDTAAELLLLNKIWVLQSQITNFFLPQQKLISKVRDGAKVTKKLSIYGSDRCGRGGGCAEVLVDRFAADVELTGQCGLRLPGAGGGDTDRRGRSKSRPVPAGSASGRSR